MELICTNIKLFKIRLHPLLMETNIFFYIIALFIIIPATWVLGDRKCPINFT